jgi:hypothetical protein
VSETDNGYNVIIGTVKGFINFTDWNLGYDKTYPTNLAEIDLVQEYKDGKWSESFINIQSSVQSIQQAIIAAIDRIKYPDDIKPYYTLEYTPKKGG